MKLWNCNYVAYHLDVLKSFCGAFGQASGCQTTARDAARKVTFPRIVAIVADMLFSQTSGLLQKGMSLQSHDIARCRLQ